MLHTHNEEFEKGNSTWAKRRRKNIESKTGKKKEQKIHFNILFAILDVYFLPRETWWKTNVETNPETGEVSYDLG